VLAHRNLSRVAGRVVPQSQHQGCREQQREEREQVRVRGAAAEVASITTPMPIWNAPRS
jgi:hypothetical protein